MLPSEVTKAIAALRDKEMAMFAYSHDEEEYEGGFDTAEQAALEAMDQDPDGDCYQYCWVGECRAPRQPETVFCRYDVENFFNERVACHDDYCVGECCEGWYKATKEQEEELAAEVRNVMAAWLNKYDLRPKFFCVENPVKYVLRDGKAALASQVDVEGGHDAD